MVTFSRRSALPISPRTYLGREGEGRLGRGSAAIGPMVARIGVWLLVGLDQQRGEAAQTAGYRVELD